MVNLDLTAAASSRIEGPPGLRGKSRWPAFSPPPPCGGWYGAVNWEAGSACGTPDHLEPSSRVCLHPQRLAKNTSCMVIGPPQEPTRGN